jgi:uroporphyrinogen decarboxylase
MNTRERFFATAAGEPLERPLYWEFGYWVPTLRRWYAEGLERITGIRPELTDDGTVAGECLGVDWRNPNLDADVNRALGFDEPIYRIPVNNLFFPPFETKLLEDHEDWYRIVDADGQTVEISRRNGSRRHLAAAVQTLADYQKLKEERLQPNLAARLPPDWPAIRQRLKARTFALEFGGNQGFFNSPRRLLGFERLLTAFYDEPQLIKMMIDDVVDFLIALYDPLLSDVGGDCAMISEDMCYKSGCFVSPAMFREFMLPAYRKLTGFYRDHGIRTILVDCDGDVTGLLPLLIEGGVTGLHPFEVTAKCDVLAVREAFPHFLILGGIDKKAVAAGPDAIDRELERKVGPLFNAGSYVPFIDHTVPPDHSSITLCRQISRG